MNNERIEELGSYVKGVSRNENTRELYDNYAAQLALITPQEAVEVFYRQLQQGASPSEILAFLDKVLHVFHAGLSHYEWKKPEAGSFIAVLMLENAALKEKLTQLKELIKQQSFNKSRIEMTRRFSELKSFNDHYIKIENILFPMLELKAKRFEGLKIMWALHDQIRISLDKIGSLLNAEIIDTPQLNTEIGKFYFLAYGCIDKEELILFPCASELLALNEQQSMLEQSFEYTFPFIDTPNKPIQKEVDTEVLAGLFTTSTGSLDFTQLEALFDVLPIDLTLIDENNKVRYFTRPKERIFPRSPSIIGRDVENCHPPDSVAVVLKIIDAFRNGDKDNADFWIQMNGKFIHIRYFALRSSAGKYLGTLEVSQNITDLRKLEGQKRLLEWE